MFLRQVYDDALAQAAYIIGCQQTGDAIVIDPERDIDRYKKIAEEQGLRITAVAETHIHADFVSGAREFAQDPTVTLYLSALGGDDWSYNWPDSTTKVSYLNDGDMIHVGKIDIQAVHTPGHTPEHMSYLITDKGGGADEPIAIATGDFLFVGAVGRPDLLESAAGMKGVMEPSARTLQESLSQKLPQMPDFIQVLPGHGAGSACGKALGAVPNSTIGYERRFNSSFKQAVSDAQGFVNDILSGQPDPPLYFARMKTVNRDGIQVTGGAPEPRKMKPTEFLAEAAKAETRVLDTRRKRSEFIKKHLEGSIFAALSSSNLPNAAGSMLEPDDPILLVLDSESDYDQARRLLYRIGLDNQVGWITFDELAAEAGNSLVELPSVNFESFDPSSDVEGAAELLDVRDTGEYTDGHVSDAALQPYSRMRSRMQELPADKRYYIYCNSGRRATIAASYMRKLGYDVVLVDGYFENYKNPVTA